MRFHRPSFLPQTLIRTFFAGPWIHDFRLTRSRVGWSPICQRWSVRTFALHSMTRALSPLSFFDKPMPLFHIHVTALAPDQLNSFDHALLGLSQLPRMFIEPDGSFVWPSAPGETPAWQLDGNLVDGGESLYYMELKGDCPEAAFAALRGVIAASETQLRIEAVTSGQSYDEASFRERLHRRDAERGTC